MSYWDEIEKMRRLMAQLDPVREQLSLHEDLMRTIEMRKLPDHVADFTKQVEAIHGSMPDPAVLRLAEQAFSIAASPLFDYPNTFLLSQDALVRSRFESVDRAIEAANFLGEIDISESDETEVDDGEITEAVEKQLVQIAPADTLEKLRRVEFAPFTLLERVARNPEAMRLLDSREFEQFVAMLVEKLGFENVILTPRSGDEGRDVLATLNVHGLSILCAIECKRYAPNRPVGPDVARALLGVIGHPATRATKGILVTTSSFTPAAKKFIVTEPSLDSRDFQGIVDWLGEYKRTHGSDT